MKISDIKKLAAIISLAAAVVTLIKALEK